MTSGSLQILQTDSGDNNVFHQPNHTKIFFEILCFLLFYIFFFKQKKNFEEEIQENRV
jgi:hypothetical protein